VSGGKQVFFPPFTLDTSNQCLQRGSERIALRPKTLAVLAHLVEHPHRLVSKEELMSAAWGEESTPFVGRDAELNRLRHHLELANAGKRQFVFVTGEPGIGKTTLIGALLKTLLISVSVITAVGLCIEQYGAGEAYLPILDLLERMCSLPIRETIIEYLRHSTRRAGSRACLF
jgi:AAA ATPase domain/Transcriptional regulatory protein, C terminal